MAFENVGGGPGKNVEVEGGRNGGGVEMALGKYEADGSHRWEKRCPLLSGSLPERRGNFAKTIVNITNINLNLISTLISFLYFVKSNQTKTIFKDYNPFFQHLSY